MKRECETLEFKKSTAQLKEAIISISAILNKHRKGELYFGISNDGKIIGQDTSEKTIRNISNAISEHIEPKIYPIITEQNKCIKVEFSGNEMPYYAFGRAYIRVGDEDRKLSAKELENMILRKSAVKWDSKMSDSEISEINGNTLREFIQKANEAKRINFKYTNKKEVLEKLNMIKDSKISNAVRLLFSKKEPVEVQAAVFAGIDKTTFLDIKQFKGNIYNLLKTGESYLREHINWRANLTGSTREEIPEVPMRAIIEVLVNSFCHRDYQAPESNKIAIFRDRIEIWNPGDFPEGYTPQDFITGKLPSILRNPQIANNLYLAADIEKWGSGLKRIVEACKAEGVEVEFTILKYGFSVQFIRPKNAPVKDTIKDTINLDKIDNQIIIEIKTNPQITADNLSNYLQINLRNTKNHLAKLKKKGFLKRIGPNKGGHWEIIE